VHLVLCIRWMQEVRRFRPSTVSRRFSVASGFYRTAVIDGVLEHSPAEHVRRPAVPLESPTLGFTLLQFEAMLTAARESLSPYGFALVAVLGLLGPRILEASCANMADLGEEHGHRVLRVCGKGSEVVLVPLSLAVGRAIDGVVGGRSAGPILLDSRGARMDRHAATRRLRNLAGVAGVRIGRTHPHMLWHSFVTAMPDAGVDLRDVRIAARHADPRTTMRYDRARNILDRHPGLHPGRVPRITYWLAPGRRIIPLTVFSKTRSAEAAEVARALQAQKTCDAEHGPALDTLLPDLHAALRRRPAGSAGRSGLPLPDPDRRMGRLQGLVYGG
jgi:integrase/recombinase XerD